MNNLVLEITGSNDHPSIRTISKTNTKITTEIRTALDATSAVRWDTCDMNAEPRILLLLLLLTTPGRTSTPSQPTKTKSGIKKIKTTSQRKKNLYNVMLTQQWSRTNWIRRIDVAPMTALTAG